MCVVGYGTDCGSVWEEEGFCGWVCWVGGGLSWGFVCEGYVGVCVFRVECGLMWEVLGIVVFDVLVGLQGVFAAATIPASVGCLTVA